MLHIETATQSCSVVISAGEQVLAVRETHIDRSHASVLTVFIEQLFRETKLQAADLDAITVSMGPGSYTGLRIGVSTAKGLAYGSRIPLIAVSTLKSMAAGVVSGHEDLINRYSGTRFLCPLIDARRMEVYSCIFDARLNKLKETSAEIIDGNSFREFLDGGTVFFFGSGVRKSKEILNHDNAVFIDGFNNSAKFMIHPALQLFESNSFVDASGFEPFYLKDFVATIPKNKIPGSENSP